MRLFDIGEKSVNIKFYMVSLDKEYRHLITESNYTSIINDKFFTKGGFGVCIIHNTIHDMGISEIIVDSNFNVNNDSKIEHRFGVGGITNIADSDFFEVNRGEFNLQVYHGLKEILAGTKPCNIYYESEILMVSIERFSSNSVSYFSKYGRKIGNKYLYDRYPTKGIVFNTDDSGNDVCFNKFGIVLSDMDVKKAEEIFQELCPKEYDYIFYKLLG